MINMQNNTHPTSAFRVIIILLIVLAASILTAKYFLEKPISVEEVTTPLDPLKKPKQNKVQDFKSFTINQGNLQLLIFPQAEYEMTAKVMSKKRYHNGWESRIIPYDLALAWGKLTESENIRKCLDSIFTNSPGIAPSHKNISEIIPQTII